MQQDKSQESKGDLVIPEGIKNKLFDYQVVGVEWMWKLHCQKVGGILGDEMGLGKTIQVVSFLGALNHQGLFNCGMVLCPATVLEHWDDVVRTWCPEIRTHIFHDSFLKKRKEGTREDAFLKFFKESATRIILTTYEHFKLYEEVFKRVNFDYMILDEGHKIKNKNAEVTLACKRVSTPHRLILTGSPVQNNLSELWSLLDFVHPGKLGSFPVFNTEFARPINLGGYKNASTSSIIHASKRASALKQLIAPNILIRKKSEVDCNLKTKKKEQILFCDLSEEQREIYQKYVTSQEVKNILKSHNRHGTLEAINQLRNICNHPEMKFHTTFAECDDKDDINCSGKLKSTMAILQNWKANGDKVLLFSQKKFMLDLFEYHFQKEGYSYRRMDGDTPIDVRNKLINEFNKQNEITVFLLTTKVGGIGVNLTGANKVLIFDPDWNPSTDVQARERAWRIGQQKDVTIYRLVTCGTIEEKIYHRQVYKQFLSESVLTDARNQRFFTAKAIKDLFKLEKPRAGTETGDIFKNVQDEITLTKEGPSNLRGKTQYSSQMMLKNRRPLAASSLSEAERQLEKDFPTEIVDVDALRLFGVKSVIDHTQIEASKDPEIVSLKLEAEKHATEALARLIQSQEEINVTDISVPTWTGTEGIAGRHEEDEKNIKKTTKRRRHVLQKYVTASESEEEEEAVTKRRRQVTKSEIRKKEEKPRSHQIADKWCDDIIKFEKLNGYKVSSAQLKEEFGTKVPDNEKSVFKKILEKMNDYEKVGNVGYWSLKPQFRS